MSEDKAAAGGEIVGFIWDIIDFDDQHYNKVSVGNATDFAWQIGPTQEHHGKIRKWGKSKLEPGEGTTFYMNRYLMGVDLEVTLRYKKLDDSNDYNDVLYIYASVPNVGENKYDIHLGDAYKDKYRVIENGWFERNMRGAASMQCDIYVSVQGECSI